MLGNRIPIAAFGVLAIACNLGLAGDPPSEKNVTLLGPPKSLGTSGARTWILNSIHGQNVACEPYRVAVTEATNKTSQHIFRKQGYVERVRRSYRDHRFDDQAVFASIVEHSGPILMDKPLTSSSLALQNTTRRYEAAQQRCSRRATAYSVRSAPASSRA